MSSIIAFGGILLIVLFGLIILAAAIGVFVLVSLGVLVIICWFLGLFSKIPSETS